MARLSNIGKFYFEGLHNNMNRRSSRFFNTQREAEQEAKKRQREGKILQADILVVKNALSDVVVSDLNLKRKITKKKKYWK